MPIVTPSQNIARADVTYVANHSPERLCRGSDAKVGWLAKISILWED